MLEQPETGENRGVAIVSLKLALSQEARASLAAVRVAQETAQRRARRQTIQARIGVALMAGAVAVGAVAWGPRVTQWRQARAHTAKALRTPSQTSTLASLQPSTRTSPVAPPPALAAATTAPAVRPAAAAQPAVAVRPTVAAPAAVAVQPAVGRPAPIAHAPDPSAPVAATPVDAPAQASGSGAPDEGCDTSTRRGLWRRSPEACARAFAADPQNASLALAVAQAEHAHARLDEAAQWAKRALALDPKAAEAYVIIARAEAENGRDEEARTAYQRYLEVAPRGWHKAEARAALRRASISSR
jgi:hypothetical protein